MVPNPDDQDVGVMTSVSALVSGLDAELRRLPGGASCGGTRRVDGAHV
jgi:hypothetical protein